MKCVFFSEFTETLQCHFSTLTMPILKCCKCQKKFWHSSQSSILAEFVCLFCWVSKIQRWPAASRLVWYRHSWTQWFTSINQSTTQSTFNKVTILQKLWNSLTVHSTPAHAKCYSYHAGTSVIVSGVVGMQQCMIWNQNEMHKFSTVKNGCKYAANNKQF